ncbi:MAG: tail fiber domain-containing protein [Bacteroidia bacterium]
MKTKLFFAILLITISSSHSKAQLKVTTAGNVGLGTTSPSQRLEVAGNGIISGGSGKLYFGTSTSTNKYLGFPTAFPSNLALISTDGNWLRIGATGGIAFWGKAGGETSGTNYNMFLNSIGLGIGSLAQAYGSVALYVVGDVRCTGLYYSSDKRFKKNIVQIDGALEKILKLNGRTYEFNRDAFKEMSFSEGKNIGFIAQELSEVFPELVKADDKGFYSVNYTAIIPVLVEAMKEQNKKITILEQAINEIKKTNLSLNIDNVSNNNDSDIKLNQNNPNPFSENTSIGYLIPSSIIKAEISIFDMQGTLLKTYAINERGSGSLLISGGELKSGMYLYSLIADGKEMDTKRMILTK